MSNLRSLVSVAALGVSLFGVSVAALAQDKAPTGPFGGNIAGTVGFTTDYVFRGISQTDENPAVQGSLEYSLPIAAPVSAYVSIWGSNVDFTDASSEIDFSGGFRGNITEALAYDLNTIYYAYPGTPNFRNYENVDFGLKLSYDLGFAVPYVGARYSPNYFGNSGHAEYYSVGATVPLAYGMLKDYGVKLLGDLSKQNIERNARFGTPDYTTWMVAVGASAFTLDFTLAYYDTDIKRAQCSGGTKLCENRVVFSVSKAF